VIAHLIDRRHVGPSQCARFDAVLTGEPLARCIRVIEDSNDLSLSTEVKESRKKASRERATKAFGLDEHSAWTCEVSVLGDESFEESSNERVNPTIEVPSREDEKHSAANSRGESFIDTRKEKFKLVRPRFALQLNENQRVERGDDMTRIDRIDNEFTARRNGHVAQTIRNQRGFRFWLAALHVSAHGT
jgi:hypothetical protein